MATRIVELVEKHPIEVFRESVDFSNVLFVGETVSSGSVTGVNAETNVSVTADLISNVANDSTSVQFDLSGGEIGERYVVTVSATLNNAQVLAQTLHVVILPYPQAS